MVSNLSKILNDVNTFVVPKTCFGCNAVLYRGEHLLCAFCRNELPLTEYNFSAENAADRLFYGHSGVRKAAALFFYHQNGMVTQLIHGLKYRGMEQIGSFFGKWYGALLSRDTGLGAIDYVLPVPLHQKKERKRGYNQCTRFGLELARALGGEFSATLLVRERSSRTQTVKNRWHRWKGTRGAFIAQSPEDLEGKRILLVDDVITTGATLGACCEALDHIPHGGIYIAAMAMVP
jgi:ComF family protein